MNIVYIHSYLTNIKYICYIKIIIFPFLIFRPLWEYWNIFMLHCTLGMVRDAGGGLHQQRNPDVKKEHAPAAQQERAPGSFSQFFPFFLVTPPLSVQLIFRSCQSFNHSIVENICKCLLEKLIQYQTSGRVSRSCRAS